MTGPGTGADHDLVHAPDAAGTDALDHNRQPDGAAGSVPLARSVAAAVAGVLAAVAAVLLVRNGIQTNTFPPFLDGTSSTTITRYSGPWLTAGAGAVLVAALLLLRAVIDLRRWLRGRRADVPADDAVAPHGDVTGATSS